MAAAKTLILLVALCLVSFQVNAQQPAGAIVEKISGTVLLKQKGKQVSLNSGSDIARVLYVGDSVHCEQGGRLSLNIAGKSTELDERSGWFTILTRRSASNSDPYQKALNEYGRIAGRNKGIVPTFIVYSPSDESVVMPELFVIRWTPLKRKCVATFMIHTPEGEELWQGEGVNGATGRLNSAAARRALRNFRTKSGEGTLQLKLKNSCGTDDVITFSLLSTADETSIKKELALWDKEPAKLIAHIGRASVFSRHRMFPLAAEEYEAALALAPQSHDLLTKTIDAHRQANNLARADQLERRLPPKPRVE